ncbi:MAG TPA: polysaccharide deacetylase family protein [Gemmatimonadaceae bacterium]|jgi:peptidoglycan/xylan/chitin deacetylase (PgdA/CDA1 family)
MTVHAKRAALALIASTVRVPYWRMFVRDVAIVFMLHRFADADRGVAGVTPENLRESLAFLRRHRFRLTSFGELLSGSQLASSGKTPLVLFTVDDGHAEFATVAAPVFAEFDCPVTVFLTTGPIDKPSWFWWDKVEYAMNATKRGSLSVELGDDEVARSWSSPSERAVAASEIVEMLKAIPNEAKLDALALLADRLEVRLPSTPPPRYAAMSWTDVRNCASRGVKFGPHTVTHPMLSQISESQAEWEISESWKRLRAECEATVPVFCYPNGVFSSRDVRILRATDLVAAVTTRPSYAARSVARAGASDARFNVPRFGYPTNRAQFVAIVTGLDRVNSYLRQGRAGWQAVGEPEHPPPAV